MQIVKPAEEPKPKKEPTMPPVFIARELQSFHWSEWDSVGRAKNAIRALEQGQFMLGAQLADAMLRDDRVSGCLLTRTDAITSFPRKLEASKADKGETVATEVTEKFCQLFPDAALSEMNRWGRMMGLGLGQLVWTFADGRWDFRLKVWHPQFISWRQDTRSYWVSTEEGQVQVTPGDGQWVLFTPYGFERAWMSALIRSLYIPWLVRQFGLRDWARWSEVYGNTIKKAYIPVAAEKDDKEKFVDQISRLATESTVVMPRTAGGKDDGFDLELMEATSTGYDGFDRLLNKAEAAIAVRILGQNLSTEVKGGSFAAAAVHGSVRHDILAGDALGLSECLGEQALKPWAQINHGNADLAPSLSWNTDPPEDMKSSGEALSALGTAMKTLTDSGMPVDSGKLAERFDIPLREDATDEEKRANGQIYDYHLKTPGLVTVNEARKRIGLPPLPDGDKPIEQVAPPEMTPPNGQPPKPGEAPNGKQPPAPGEKPFAQASLLAGSKADPLIAGQVAADQLADHAAKDGAKAVRPGLVELLAAIDAAKGDFEDLRRRLQAVVLDPEELAIVLEKAMVLAELNGRLSVLEGL